MDPVVMKFGGTSVEDVPALQRLIDIVRAEPRKKVIVVSALAGVTDALSALAATSEGGPNTRVGVSGGTLAGGTRPAIAEVTEALCARHVGIVRSLVAAGAQEPLIERLRLRFASVATTVRQADTGLSPRDRDALLAIGELASSEVVAAVLTSAGVPAAWTDARQVIVTDAGFGSAKPDGTLTRAAAACAVRPLLDAARVPVIGGFIGATVAGLTTTLGRGGSDYSASLIGASLDAREIQIWTDVDGVMSADPRVVAEPVLMPQLTFREAYELARFGAKVLHWGTLEPAALHNIPVRVLNARRGDARGTTIAATPIGARPVVVGLAYHPRVRVADLAPSSVIGCLDFVRTATEWLERDGRGLMVISLSPSRLVVAAQDERVLRGLTAALGGVAGAGNQCDGELVTVVGPGVVASSTAWTEITSERAHRLVLEAIPAQSGDAIVCVAPPGAGVRLLKDLHNALVDRVPAAQPAHLFALPLPTSTGGRVGTQSIAGA